MVAIKKKVYKGSFGHTEFKLCGISVVCYCASICHIDKVEDNRKTLSGLQRL